MVEHLLLHPLQKLQLALEVIQLFLQGNSGSSSSINILRNTGGGNKKLKTTKLSSPRFIDLIRTADSHRLRSRSFPEALGEQQ